MCWAGMKTTIHFGTALQLKSTDFADASITYLSGTHVTAQQPLGLPGEPPLGNLSRARLR